MRNLKMFWLTATLFFVGYAFTQAQQSVYYQKAAKLYREAAAKTKCPSIRGKVLIEYAEWNERMVKVLAGTLSKAGEEPTKPVPPCDGDMIGGGSGNLNSSTMTSSDSSKELQLRQQQTQLELDGARNIAEDAYQNAITAGKKDSGAMVDATLAMANQISDPTGQAVYTGVGLGVSLLMHLGEKKQERLEEEAKIEAERKRKQMIIDTKEKFIYDAIKINKYEFADLISKERFAAFIVIPENLTVDMQKAYFTVAVKVSQYSDNTYPLKDEIEKKILSNIEESLIKGNKIKTIYPITNIDTFQDDFIEKMGSANLVNLDIGLISFISNPFTKPDYQNETNNDFWGNETKKAPQKKKNNTKKKK